MVLSSGLSGLWNRARRPLGLGTAVSICLHAVLAAVVIFFVHGTAVAPPPPPHPVLLDLSAMSEPQLMTQPRQPPPPQVQPPPKLAPLPPKIPPPVATTAAPAAPPIPKAPPKPPEKTLPVPQPKLPVAPQAPAKPSGAVSHKVTDDFHRKLEAAIRNNLRYPPIARRQGREGSPTVRVRMKRDGTLISVRLVDGSGTESLDREAQEVFYRIGRLPPMPADFMPDASEFDFQLAINFKLLGFGD